MQLLADVVESEYDGPWALHLHSELDADAANEVLRVLRDDSRRSRLEHVYLDMMTSRIDAIARLFCEEDVPCSLDYLVLPEESLSLLSDIPARECSPCPFMVGFKDVESVSVSTLTAFASKMRLKRLTLEGWAQNSSGPPVVMADLEHLVTHPADSILWSDIHAAVRSILPIFASSPNLRELNLGTLNHVGVGSDVLVPLFAQGIVRLRGLKKLNIGMMKVTLAADDIVPLILSEMASLEVLAFTAKEVLRPEAFRELALCHPRLRSFEVHFDGGSLVYDEIFRSKMEWLQTVALSTYLPLGDLNRELAAYL
jgi:hypothetical protein